jgi:hypothetical protein
MSMNATRFGGIIRIQRRLSDRWISDSHDDSTPDLALASFAHFGDLSTNRLQRREAAQFASVRRLAWPGIPRVTLRADLNQILDELQCEFDALSIV